MANFEVNDSSYSTDMNKLETTTPAHADIFNEMFGALINNDAFIKKVAEKQMKLLQSHLSNEDSPHQSVFNAYYQQLIAYTDKGIADLINGAPTTLDTLKELADSINENKSVQEALDAAIGTKANQMELDQAVDDITSLNSGLAKHKISGDHDGRYYTEEEVNNLLARYYLKTDVDNKIINAKPSVNNISSSAAVTINSGSTADITISVAASGKTPVLATCIDTGNHMCYVCALTLIANNVTIRLKNISTVGGVSCRPTVRVLYVPN